MINKIKEIDFICKKYNITDYIINKDGSIDVDNNVYLYGRNLKNLPLKFNIVDGNCILCENDLISLKGSPVYVSGDFDCEKNKLMSLKFSPKEIGGHFKCIFNKLKTLEYGPQKVGSGYYCGDNELITLKGMIKRVFGNFYCSNNKLMSLEYGPEYVYGNYLCSNNKLKNLKGCAKYVDVCLNITNNPDLYSFEGLTHEVKNIECYNTKIYNVWKLFKDNSKIELFNDMDIIRENNIGEPVIILDRLNEFLDMIGKPRVKSVKGYINI